MNFTILKNQLFQSKKKTLGKDFLNSIKDFLLINYNN